MINSSYLTVSLPLWFNKPSCPCSTRASTWITGSSPVMTNSNVIQPLYSVMPVLDTGIHASAVTGRVQADLTESMARNGAAAVPERPN